MFLGLVLGFLTSISWALGNVFIQRSGRAVGGPRALTWALGIGGGLSALAAVAFDERTAAIDGRSLGWVALAALSGLSAYATIFYSFTRAKLSLAVPFITCWSLVAGIFSMTVLGHSVRGGQLLGAAIVVLGVVLVSISAGRSQDARPEASASHPHGPADAQMPAADGGWRPLVAALISGISFGIMVPAMGEATPAFGTFGVASVVYLLGLVLAVPLCLVVGINLSPPPKAAFGVVLGAGIFETLGFVCLNAAGRFAPMVVVAPVASLAAALTVLYAAIFLRERPGWLALCGALCASVGVVVLAF
ncbi:MAG TPA: DMT family transporter [Polyangia bacterium]